MSESEEGVGRPLFEGVFGVSGVAGVAELKGYAERGTEDSFATPVEVTAKKGGVGRGAVELEASAIDTGRPLSSLDCEKLGVVKVRGSRIATLSVMIVANSTFVEETKRSIRSTTGSSS